tara:strand:+ start:191 stop:367 length:177 start_codon:yes stop_codon:yes gene_type:complete
MKTGDIVKIRLSKNHLAIILWVEPISNNIVFTNYHTYNFQTKERGCYLRDQLILKAKS